MGGETQSSTNALIAIRRNTAPYITTGFLTNANDFPYAIPEVTDVTGVSMLNGNSTTALTMTLTFADTSTFVIPVNASGVYTGYYNKAITSIDSTGDTFTIELLSKDVT